MRVFKICMIPAIAGFLCSCESESERTLPAIGSKTLTFYGRVNEFAYMDGAPVDVVLETLKDELEACASDGVDGYQIELWGWVRYSGLTPEQGMERIRVVWPELVKWCRALDLWLFVSGANDNQHLGKYGSVARTLEQDWKHIEECLALVAASGPDNVIVQPVCETQTDDGARMEKRWAEVLSPLGFYFIDNHGSRPKKPQSWSQGIVVHPWNAEGAANADPSAWVNNDTGIFIQQLAADATMTGPFAADRIARYVGDALLVGRPAVMVYSWGYSAVAGIDRETIKAIGSAKP